VQPATVGPPVHCPVDGAQQRMHVDRETCLLRLVIEIVPVGISGIVQVILLGCSEINFPPTGVISLTRLFCCFVFFFLQENLVLFTPLASNVSKTRFVGGVLPKELAWRALERGHFLVPVNNGMLMQTLKVAAHCGCSNHVKEPLLANCETWHHFRYCLRFKLKE
jgi:hypothetical protein